MRDVQDLTILMAALFMVLWPIYNHRRRNR
jgi:hypothetical protein